MLKFILTLPLLLAACDLSPDSKLPSLFADSAFKEATPEPLALETAPDGSQWKRVDEKARIDDTAWWKVLNLAELDALEEQAMQQSPTLDIALQRLLAAQGVAEVANAPLLPSVGVGFGPQRQQSPAANINANLPPGTNVTTKPFTTYTAQGNISYTLDLFGKNRNTAKAAAEDAAAEENNYRAARLTLQAQLAQAYIEHTSLQAEEALLAKTVKGREATRNHIQQKLRVGMVDDLTVASAETELANAQAEHAVVLQQLAVAEHKIAALVGTEPQKLQLKAAAILTPPPSIPAGVPAQLLTRRPDIQTAARMMAAANARIGAARAGYFPDISLSAVGGFTSVELSDLLKKPSQFWSLGGLNGAQILTQPLFEGGRITGTLAARKADYAQAEANYRATALQALREAEDTLSSLKNLSDQARARRAARDAAKRAYAVADQRFKVGYSSQIEFLDAERNNLAAERADIQVLGQRYISTIQLIQAMGGSWNVPTVQATEAKK